MGFSRSIKKAPMPVPINAPKIGISAVKGLAAPSNTPCIPVSTLDGMAEAFIDRDCIVCAVMDARCNQFYNALFKIKNGIIKSCEKRPVSLHEIDQLVADIEKQIYNSMDREISSKKIGEMVMNGLKGLDDVAYIRFASVYRQFKDSNTFLEELKKMLEKKLKKL